MNLRKLQSYGMASCFAWLAFHGAEAGTPPDDFFTPAEWEIIETLSPLPEKPPANLTNRYADNEAAARFGQKIFFDSGFSGPLQVGDDGVNGGLGVVGERGRVSCVSCHEPNNWFIDTRSNPNNVSLGARWQKRNSPTMVNIGYWLWHGLAGQQDRLWTQGALTHESRVNMLGDRLSFVHFIRTFYRGEYNALFDTLLPEELDPAHPDHERFPFFGRPKRSQDDPDGPWEQMAQEDRDSVMLVLANQGKAMEAYLRRLVSGNAPFDRYVAGDRDAILPEAKHGLRLFVGAAYCIECHKGPFFTDQGFHNLGVPQVGPHVPTPNDTPPWDRARVRDLPRARNHAFNGCFNPQYSDDPDENCAKWELIGASEPTAADLGAIRTASLRNVAMTPPYMHTGGFPTLLDVLDFYDVGGGTANFLGHKDPKVATLNLTDEEKNQLVAFLETLTGEEVPEEYRVDIRKPRLVGIVDALDPGFNRTIAIADTFIWPYANHPETALREVVVDLINESELLDATVEFTGDPAGAPTVVGVDSLGGGRHVVRLDPPVEPGQWAKITLRLQSIGPRLEGTVVIWLAHHPNDINRDGVVNIADATAFGEAFREGQDPFLLDLNGDGQVDVRDATEFGDNWHGTGGVPVAWEGHQLPPKPE